jgi:hypothetical protein
MRSLVRSLGIVVMAVAAVLVWLRAGALLVAFGVRELSPSTGSTHDAIASEPAETATLDRPSSASITTTRTLASLASKFPRSAATRSFRLASEIDAPLDELGRIAEKTRREARWWLGMPAESAEPAPIFEIYVCKSAEAISAVELAHGLPLSRQKYRWRQFPGYCDFGARVILLPAERSQDYAESVAHEVCHAVLGEYASRQPSFVDEGLAMLVADWIANSEALSPELASSSEPRWQAECGRASFVGALAPLHDLVEIDWWEFQREPARATHFALAWSFAKFLAETRTRPFAGRYRDFLYRLSTGEEAWRALEETYDVDAVERGWRKELDGWTEWEAVNGVWNVDVNDTVSVRCDAHGWSCLLSRDRPASGAPIRLGFWLPEAPQPTRSIGLVIGYRGTESMIAARILDGGARVAISERVGCATPAGVEWDDCVVADVPSGMLNGSWVDLRCDERGRVRLLIAGSTIAAADIGARAFDGRIGWFCEQTTHAPDTDRRSHFVFTSMYVDR